MILGRFDIALLGALAFVLVGLGRGDTWFFFWGPPGWIQGLLWLLFVAGIVAIVLVVVNQQPRPVPQPYGPATGSRARTPASAPQDRAGPWRRRPPPRRQRRRRRTRARVRRDARPTRPPLPRTRPRPTAPTRRRHRPRRATTTARAGDAPPLRPSHRSRRSRGRPARAPDGRRGRRAQPADPRDLLVAERTGDFDGPVALTALGVAIVLAGLGIIVSGLRGRTSGALGGLAVLGLVAAVPLGVVTSASSFWQDDGERQFSATDVSASTRSEAAAGYSMGFGDVTVDLTAVPLTDDTLVVPIALAAGESHGDRPRGRDRRRRRQHRRRRDHVGRGRRAPGRRTASPSTTAASPPAARRPRAPPPDPRRRRTGRDRRRTASGRRRRCRPHPRCRTCPARRTDEHREERTPDDETRAVAPARGRDRGRPTTRRTARSTDGRRGRLTSSRSTTRRSSCRSTTLRPTSSRPTTRSSSTPVEEAPTTGPRRRHAGHRGARRGRRAGRPAAATATRPSSSSRSRSVHRWRGRTVPDPRRGPDPP